ncbi:hypothetical protein D3C73_1485340 [compost metagenome]
MVAVFNKGQNRVGNGCGAAGKQGATRAAFQLAHGFLQGEMRQRAAASVKKCAVSAVVGGLFFSLNGFEYQ